MSFNIKNYSASLDALSKKEEKEFLEKDQFESLIKDLWGNL